MVCTGDYVATNTLAAVPPNWAESYRPAVHNPYMYLFAKQCRQEDIISTQLLFSYQRYPQLQCRQ
jgi:hypothetical protein